MEREQSQSTSYNCGLRNEHGHGCRYNRKGTELEKKEVVRKKKLVMGLKREFIDKLERGVLVMDISRQYAIKLIKPVYVFLLHSL